MCWLSAPGPAHAKVLEPVSRVEYLDKIPSRADQLAKLAHGTERDPFDVLIIGGGATGTGCAVDAITRSAADGTLVADTTPLYLDSHCRLACFLCESSMACSHTLPHAYSMPCWTNAAYMSWSTLKLGWRPCPCLAGPRVWEDLGAMPGTLDLFHLAASKHSCLRHTCRGLRTALVEREDFAAGTSSRSTKLVHGGVRYLEKAVWKLDYGQLKLVFEALQASALMWLQDTAAGVECSCCGRRLTGLQHMHWGEGVLHIVLEGLPAVAI